MPLEFKEFAFRGNMLDLAVGIILGVAFGGVVNSLAEDVLLNVVAAIAGEPDFSQLTLQLGRGVIRYGEFLTTVINFLIVAFALFLIVRPINRAQAYKECPYCLKEINADAARCSFCTSRLKAD
ncbi:MAG: large conductance mechanosensitive channel protein MscL [Egibacteraceae bacterium]